MNNLKFIFFALAVFCSIVFCSNKAMAVSYALTVFNYDVDAGRVYGTSQTYLDYTLDPYYNAGVDGYLIRYTDDTLQNYVILNSGSVNHSNNAIIHTVANVQRGQIYAVISQHFIQTLVISGGGYYDPYGLSRNFTGTGGNPYHGFQYYPPVYVPQWFNIGATGVIVGLPNITQLAPDSALAGTTPVIQIHGKYIGEHTNIPPVVSVSGSGVTPQFQNYLPTGVEMAFQIAEDAATGNRTVRLTADGVPSNSVTFRIGDQSPQITNMTPPQGNTGEQVSVTITGTNFGVNPQVVIDGLGVSPTITSATSTEIQANFSIADTTYIGNRNVKVKSNGRIGGGFTPGPGNLDTSNSLPFNVLEQNYTAAIETVGFNADFPVKRFTDQTLIADPTWRKGNSNNAKNYVAYIKGAEANSMNMSATLKIAPVPLPEGNLTAKVRVKYGGNVIATESYSTTVNGNTITVEELFFDGRLESMPKVKKGTYNFDWEVSFDNGQTWKPSGTSQHIIFWTYGDVVEPQNCESDGIPRNCLFVNNLGTKDYAGLFDTALDKTIGAITELESSPTPVPQTPDGIANFLAYQIDKDVQYNPSNDGPDRDHPLKAYNVTIGVQCAVNANLLRGLLRSIGINNSETVYIWGGKPFTTDKRETGGLTYGYKVVSISRSSGGSSNPFIYSLQAIRPASDDVFKLPTDPHFTFHAMVKVFDEPENTEISILNARYYDPSYAKRLEDSGRYKDSHPYTNKDLIYRKAADLNDPDPKKWKFVKDDETKPFVVRDLSLRSCLPNNRNTCDPAFTIIAKKTVTDWVAAHPRTSVFDAQGVSTFTVWRPSDGVWYTRNSYANSNIFVQFGLNGDKPVPGDYDGDGVTDYAVFRPNNTTLYILESSSQTLRTFVWNSSSDKPVYGDFDGDGKSDIAFYRSDHGSHWFITRSSDGVLYSLDFGAIEDKPVSGDFDGDGKTDLATYRPSNGTWSWWKSTDGTWNSQQFGVSQDIPVPGDYNGDGRTDFAVYRPSNNRWYFLFSNTGNYGEIQMGVAGDIPVPGDYDGDAKMDAAVWSPSSGHWLVINSSDGTTTEDYWGGQSHGDIPVGAAFIY